MIKQDLFTLVEFLRNKTKHVTNDIRLHTLLGSSVLMVASVLVPYASLSLMCNHNFTDTPHSEIFLPVLLVLVLLIEDLPECNSITE